jgi:hypothetical protein
MRAIDRQDPGIHIGQWQRNRLDHRFVNAIYSGYNERVNLSLQARR